MLIGCLAAAAGPAGSAGKGSPGAGPEYPATRTIDQVDDHHGTPVADPYRWLEDADSPRTADWVAAQNRATFAFLESIPARATLRARLTALWNHPRPGAPFRAGDRWFSTRNDGPQSQTVLCVQEDLRAEPRVLLDPDALSTDGTVAVTGLVVSRDGRWLAWSASESGSDWQTWRVRDVRTGEDLPDIVRWSRFSGAAWSQDGAGFYYSRYGEPAAGQARAQANRGQQVWHHRIGTPQADDTLVYGRPDRPEWGFEAQISDDGRWLVLHVGEGTDRRNRVFIRDLMNSAAPVVELLDAFDAGYEFVGSDGGVFWFLTDLDAPRGRLIAVDTARPAREQWREIVPEGPDVLRSVKVLNRQFVAQYLRDAHDAVRRFTLAGEPLGEVTLPGPGSVSGFAGRPGDSETFFVFASFLNPPEVHRLDLVTGRTSLHQAATCDFDFDRYETRQVFFASRDGTRIPMFLVHRRDLRRDGGNPTLLYGYGGFNAAMTPFFSADRLAWLELGGVFALPNLRGGGEYGETWHRAGMLDRKQNVFDDFIAAAEWLIAEGYTSPPKLAIAGASNGGLLVGTCLVQRPDLFGAALPAAGVMDMLRFHLFTTGSAWVPEYGSPENPEQFRALRAYSPYHNLQPGTCYPPTLVTAADHDDRVVPGHSYKFAARLQAVQACANPVLIRVETRAGHGAGRPTARQIDEAADRYAFLVRALGME